MGWADRARVAALKLKSDRYRVRRWTAFEYPATEGSGKAAAKQREQLRKQNEERLDTAVNYVGPRLARLHHNGHAIVKRVGVKRKPQLMFELEIVASSPEDAERLAKYRIERALQVKVPNPLVAQGGRRVMAVTALFPHHHHNVRLPWGNIEVGLLD